MTVATILTIIWGVVAICMYMVLTYMSCTWRYLFSPDLKAHWDEIFGFMFVSGVWPLAFLVIGGKFLHEEVHEIRRDAVRQYDRDLRARFAER